MPDLGDLRWWPALRGTSPAQILQGRMVLGKRKRAIMIEHTEGIRVELGACMGGKLE